MTPVAALPGSSVAVLDAERIERSVLDLLHPDGIARRVGWLGPAQKTGGRSHDTSSVAEGRVYDALLIEPSLAGSGSGDWVEWTLSHVDRLLGVDGVAYVVIPRRLRRRLLRDLPGKDFRVSAAYIHVPYGSATTYIAECDTAALGLLSRLMPIRPSHGRIIQAGLHLPAKNVWLPLAAQTLGFAVQRTVARRLFEWATCRTDGDPPDRARLIRIKERSGSRIAILWVSGERSAPCAVVKRALTASAGTRIRAELDALECLGPSASAAGAMVPTAVPLSSPLASARYGYFTSVPADAVLAAQPDRLHDVVQQLAGWLERWNSGTRKPHQIDTRWLGRELLEPAHAVRTVLESPESYFRWLSEACARLAGRTLNVVTSHGDLTMSNVLLTESGSMAIVDWESARIAGLPLSDFYYAAADALAAQNRYKDRAGALAETFTPQTEYGQFVEARAASIDRWCAADPQLTQVLLHATALQHAADEQQKGRIGLQPFASLVRVLEARVQERRP